MGLAVPALTAARERIDAVNVFPVADGDTGTNVLLTVRGAADEVAALDPAAAGADVRRALGRGALLGARGSSGVILSRYLGGLVEAADLPLPDALGHAADAARAAVHRPEDGTVLTMAARVAEGARAARAARTVGVAQGAEVPQDAAGDEAADLVAGVEAGRADLAGISAGHPVLRSARVVDAGACALLVLLDALAEALRGSAGPVDVSWLDEHAGGDPAAGPGAGAAERAFEVMAVVRDAGPVEAERLRAGLSAVGDAVAVVDGDGLLTAHVHADDPVAVLAVIGTAGVIHAGGSTPVGAVGASDPAPAAPGGWWATVRVLVGVPRPVVACTAHPALAGTLALAGAVALVLPDGVPEPEVRSAVARAVQDARTSTHGPGPEAGAGSGDAERRADEPVVVLTGDRLPAGAADPAWTVPAGVLDDLRVLAAVVAGPGASADLAPATGSAADAPAALAAAERLLAAAASDLPAPPAAASRTLTVLLGAGASSDDGLDLADHLGARHPDLHVAVAGPVPAGPAFGLALAPDPTPGTPAPVPGAPAPVRAEARP